MTDEELWTANGSTLIRGGCPAAVFAEREIAEWVAEACNTLAELEAAQADWEASGEAPSCAVINVGGEQMRMQGGAEMPQPIRDSVADVIGAARRAIAEEKAAERAEILRQAATDLLTDGHHTGGCGGSPHADGSPLPDHAPKPGRCGCALGQHYRWLMNRADGIAQVGPTRAPQGTGGAQDPGCGHGEGSGGEEAAQRRSEAQGGEGRAASGHG